MIKVLSFLIVSLAVPSYAKDFTEALTDLDAAITTYGAQVLPSLPTLQSTADALPTVADVYRFVQQEISFEPYIGYARGPLGTLQGKTGNDLDQAALLVAILRAKNIECRFVRGRISDEKARWLVGRANTKGSEHDKVFAEPGESALRTELAEKLLDHFWVQAHVEETWNDLDPCFSELSVGKAVCAADETFDEIPDDLTHKVTMELRCRYLKNGEEFNEPLGTQELRLADVYNTPITILNQVELSFENGDPILEKLQPVFQRGTDLIPGVLITRRDGGDAKQAADLTGASRLGSIFTESEESPEGKQEVAPPANLEIIAEWVDLFFTAPASPEQLLSVYLIDASDPLEPGIAKPLDKLETVIAFYLSPVKLPRDAYLQQRNTFVQQAQAYTAAAQPAAALNLKAENLKELSTREELTRFEREAAVLKRGLAWMVVLHHVVHSDQYLSAISANAGIPGFHSGARCLASTLARQGNNLVYSLNLQRNAACFVVPDNRPAGWEKLLTFSRGLLESRLEGAVLKSFTGKSGVTAADVLQRARQGQIPLHLITNENVNDTMGSAWFTAFPGYVQEELTTLVQREQVVLLPEKPVGAVVDKDLAWFALDPLTGYLEGLFPRDKHMGMVEQTILEYEVGCIAGNIQSYALAIEVGFAFGMTAGAWHFINCSTELPAEDCYGSAEVCGPAYLDAANLCSSWGELSGKTTLNITTYLGIPDLTTIQAGHDPCLVGIRLGLAMTGCL